jgi:C-terminal processing protease CtpA/Prc
VLQSRFVSFTEGGNELSPSPSSRRSRIRAREKGWREATGKGVSEIWEGGVSYRLDGIILLSSNLALELGAKHLANRPYRTLLTGSILTLLVGGAYVAGQRLHTINSSPLTPVRLAQNNGNPLTSLASGGNSIGLHSTSNNNTPNVTPQDAESGQDTFDTVYGLVKDNYYSKLPTETKMSQGAVKAMVASLEDANSFYLDPTQYQLVQAEGKGKHAGIGAALQIKPLPKDGYADHQLVVVSALPGSPAEKAGLKTGDVITQIEGRNILGYNPLIPFSKIAKRFQDKEATEEEFEKARLATISRLRGSIGHFAVFMLLRGDKSEVKKLVSVDPNAKLNPKPDAKAIKEPEKPDPKDMIANKASYVLLIQRNGVKEPIKVIITPSVTEVPALISKTLTDNTLHIKIPFFAETTGDEFEKAIATIVPDAPGIILDLRGNPGGFFEGAQKINGILGGGKILATEVGARGKRVTLPSEATPIVNRPPITVLVDKGTAATAEALAAALADAGVATIAGSNTFGDAQVVNLYTLADGSAFTLTTGKLISPKERNWAGTGLVPSRGIATNLSEAQVLAQATQSFRKTMP